MSAGSRSYPTRRSSASNTKWETCKCGCAMLTRIGNRQFLEPQSTIFGSRLVYKTCKPKLEKTERTERHAKTGGTAHRRIYNSETKNKIEHQRETNVMGNYSPTPITKENLREDQNVTISGSYANCPKKRHHHLYNHKYMQFL